MSNLRTTSTIGTAALAAFALLGSAGPAVADERFWTEPDGGAFEDSTNWDDGELDAPGPDDVAIFDLPTGYAVGLGSLATVDRFIVRQGLVTLDLVGVDAEVETLNTLTLTPGFAVGDITGATGVLRLPGGGGGAVHAVFAELGAAPGSTGSLILEGAMSALEVTEELRVGNGGTGFLEVLDGASVGAPVVALGRAGGAYGQAVIAGDGSTLNASLRVSVGSSGSGELRIENGALVTSGAGIIGQIPGSSGEVIVTDATWMIDGPLDVGLNGFGTLRIEQGGVVDTRGFGTIGAFGDGFDLVAQGDVIVDGAGSRWTIAGDQPGENPLYVGFAGRATLTSARGGRVDADGDLVVNSGDLNFVLNDDSLGGVLIDFAGRLRGEDETPDATISFDDDYGPTPGDRFTLLEGGSLGVDRVDAVVDDSAPPTFVSQTMKRLEVFVLDEACQTPSDDCNGNGVDDGCDLAYGIEVDCNSNGVPDTCDIADGIADDCNNNGAIDTCEIDGGVAEDCNENGIPDGCEVRDDVDVDSGIVSPVSFAEPVDFELGVVPDQTQAVHVTVSIVADLDLSFERLEFFVNGFALGSLFEEDGEACPDEPQVATLVIPAPEFNYANGLAPETVLRIRPRSLFEDDCDGATWLQAVVTYQTFGGPLDTNGNGIPDNCECVGDIDGSGDVGFTDLLQVLADWGPCPPDEDCPSDLDGDGDVGFTDLLTVLARWGPCDA